MTSLIPNNMAVYLGRDLPALCSIATPITQVNIRLYWLRKRSSPFHGTPLNLDILAGVSPRSPQKTRPHMRGICESGGLGEGIKLASER